MINLKIAVVLGVLAINIAVAEASSPEIKKAGMYSIKAEDTFSVEGYKSALLSGDVDKVRSLLDDGMSVETQLGGKLTGAFIAVHRGNPELLELFISRGADVNNVWDGQYDALGYLAKYVFPPRNDVEHIAAYKRVVQLLLEHGLDPKGKTASGKTAESYFRESNWNYLADYLKSYSENKYQTSSVVNKSDKNAPTPTPTPTPTPVTPVSYFHDSVIHSSGLVVDSSKCDVELLTEYFNSEEQPRWHGLCWDGKAQGPGFLSYNRTRTGLYSPLDGKGLVINGVFKTGPLLSNAKTKQQDGGRSIDLKNLTPEEFDFFEKFEKAESIKFAGGCKLIAGGLFERKWMASSDSKLHRFGSAWIDKNGVKVYRAVLPRHLKLIDQSCDNGLLQGTVHLKWYANDVVIHNVVNGIPLGKITYHSSDEQSYFWYYKGIWFDKYEDFLRTVRAFDKHYNRHTELAYINIGALSKGSTFYADTPEAEYLLKKKISELIDAKFKVSASSSLPKNWDSTILGIGFEGVEAGTDFYLHADVKPQEYSNIPDNISSITVELDVNLIFKETIRFAFYQESSQKLINHKIAIELTRDTGFKLLDKRLLQEVKTYISSGSAKGMQIKLEEPKPNISIISVRVK